MKAKKGVIIVLIIALASCLISMVGTSLMQGNWGKTEVSTYTGTLSDLAGMISKNTEANGKVVDITFTQDANYNFSFMVLKPNNATAENPAPAIICCHGGSNSREMQMSGYIELARRGFVVITIDASGHGRSDYAIGALTHDSYGMEAAAEYAMSLDYVDNSKIGVTGHSMGNSACVNTILALNTEGSNNHIAAWLEGSGTNAAFSMTSDSAKDLIWGISCGKYDEFDTVYTSAYTFMTSDIAKTFIKIDYPDFSEDAVIQGDWYTAKGDIGQIDKGTAIDATQAITIYNPSITHPMFHFSTTGSAITIDFFYNAFGVPNGANYMASTNQVWWIMVCFELLGLLGFFALLFPVATLLLQTPLFAKLKRTDRVLTELPSIKSWKEWMPLTVTLLALVAFAFFTYYKSYPYGSSYAFDNTIYAAGGVPNGIAYWTLICGLFAIAMICINYGLRKLLHIKDHAPQGNPFAPAALDSVSHFFRILLYVFTTVAIMYIPVYIAYYVFNADFRICSFVVALPQYKELPLFLVKYLPLWAVFYVPNAILNANTRFKEIPEWVTTVICSVANSLALIVFLFIQYGMLYSKGHLWQPNAGMAGIVAFAIIPCLAFAAFSARFIYKKTGSAWAAGLMNALIMCLVACTLAQCATDVIFPF